MLLLHKRVIACLATDVFGVVVFRGVALPGSSAVLVTLLKVVSFCGFLSLVVLPPGPLFVVLGGRPSPAWALPIRAKLGFPFGSPTRFSSPAVRA